MIDIVERLREFAVLENLDVCNEAAAEIERLRAQATVLEGELDRLEAKYGRLKELH